MISAIILAGGRSRRMGRPKLLLPFAGRTVIGHIVGQILAGPVQQAIVVVAQGDDGVAAALAGLPVTFVSNPNPDGDMLSSVRCGLKVVAPDCEGVLVALGDQPSITSELVRRMVSAFRAAGGSIVVPAYHGQRGHPILFAAKYAQEVLTQYDDVGLRGLPQAHADEVTELAVEGDAVLSDMDWPEDYRRELARFQRRGDGQA